MAKSKAGKAADVQQFDLLGDPIPRNRGGKGRPEHIPTVENQRVIVLAFAMGKKDKEAAAMLGITVPTLKKHYFSEWSRRNSASLRAEGVVLSRLDAQSRAGNVAATKELSRRLDKAGIAAMADKVATRGRAEAKTPQIGKKEAAKEAAANAQGRTVRRAPPPGIVLQ